MKSDNILDRHFCERILYKCTYKQTTKEILFNNLYLNDSVFRKSGGGRGKIQKNKYNG